VDKATNSAWAVADQVLKLPAATVQATIPTAPTLAVASPLAMKQPATETLQVPLATIAAVAALVEVLELMTHMETQPELVA